MYKCDRCHVHVAAGELPACIEAYPQEVQTIGPRDENIAQAKQLAQETGGHIYGLYENGGTNTIYDSPVPSFSMKPAAIAALRPASFFCKKHWWRKKEG